MRHSPWLTLFCCISFFLLVASSMAQLPVRFQEGSLHGFLVLRTLEGEILASGDLIQTVRGGRITARLTFHFKDGSLSDETAVYTQRRQFRLVTDHLVQKGPSFPHPLDVLIDASKNNVTVRYKSEGGQEKVKSEQMGLPPDLANGILSTLIKNISPQGGETKLSMIVTTPKPRLVKLAIHPEGKDTLTIGGSRRDANHFVIKIEIGGITGVIAPIVGKEPPDLHFWTLRDAVPTFLKSEGPLYQDGPIWRIELTSPTWPDKKSHE
jgi:hypothetical protein